MYIRCTRQKNKTNDQTYATHRLVESYRNERGQVRQQTLLNLGSQFNIPKAQWKLLADRIEEITHGQQSLIELESEIEKEAQRIAKLVISKLADINNKKEQNPQQKTELPIDTDKTEYQTVDINSLQHQHIRKIGAEHVGLHAARQLRLDTLLEELGFNRTQVHLGLATVIGRLVFPGSELSTHRYLSEVSALDELLETDFSKLSLKNFYKVADLLYKHKQKIESALYVREKDLFNFEETITLYDLTNTYFEGRCLSNPKAHYGRSKEKRSDCCLVALGMVLDASGFPKRSEIFSGNVSEPQTLEKMLATLGDNHATIVLDAGIATEESIAWLKAKERKYIVVSRKQNLLIPEEKESVIIKKTKHNEVKVILTENKETDELELYCHSSAKQKKSHSMVNKFSERFETELEKTKQGLSKKGCSKKYQKILEKIGRLKQKYSKAAKYYEVSVKTDENNKKVVDITWQKKENVAEDKLGYYCLRTNHKDLDEKTFWRTYTMLTELEAAFRSLKSELGLRPIYHQKEHRIDAHLFISIIAYHLLHTIRYQLKEKGIHASWQTLREMLDTQCRITSSLQLQDGRSVQIRKTSSPDTNQAQIYNALGIDRHPGKTKKVYF
jgi:Transposase DDE domain